MNANVPPQGGFGGAPAPPVAVQQTTVIQMGSAHKNVGLAILLAFLFGPLGMLYATITGGIVMFFVNIVVAVLTLGLGLFITIPLGILWAGLAASSHNKGLQAVATQQAAGGHVPTSVGPAAWHDDPDGSGRLRYYDGTRWTDHYADKPGQPSAAPAQPAAVSEQLPRATEGPTIATEVIEEKELAVVLKPADAPARSSCASCDHDIDPQARFCSACGQAQAPA